MQKPWTVKYAPKSLNEFVGNVSKLEVVKKYMQEWSRRSKPVWVWGSIGCGKSSSAYLLAEILDLELIEVNASDKRNAKGVEEVIGRAVKQGSLFGKKKLILVDEVDGLSGNSDRGAIPTLLKTVKNSSYPIFITGVDPFNKKFKKLRKECELVEYERLSVEDVVAKLTFILDKEGVTHDISDVQRVARSCNGDLRAAINDIQISCMDGRLILDEDHFGQRERTEGITQALFRVFKTTKAEIAKGAYDNINEDINSIMLWLDQNISEEYKKIEDLQRAYEALSTADIFLGRIRRWQYYRFYVYAYDFTSAGIALAKDEKYPSKVTYKQTTRLLQIWMAKQKQAKKRAISEKIALKTHTSSKRALGDVSFLQYMLLQGKGDKLTKYFDLSSEEIAWLKK